jgi:DNA polymerase-3 subunit gamma/tau
MALVDEKLLQEILGLAERRILYELSAAVINGDAQRCVELVAEVVNRGRDLNRLSRDLVEHFRNLLVARVVGKQRDPSMVAPAQLLDLPDQEIADLGEQIREISLETLLDYFDFMTASDEEIARSATPRFALETALIRLATLPKALPVGELIERLERLEGKFTGAPKPRVAAERTAETRVSAPPSASAPRPTLENAPIAAPTGDWPGFIAFVGKEQKFLASHLQSATAIELPPGPLKIGVAERHHLAFLQDGDNLAALKDLANRFFSQDVAVQITDVGADSARQTRDPAAAASAADERSEMVKEALRIFGGSVRNVRRDNG